MIKKSKYLELLQERSVTPNFWCSDEYFRLAALEELYADGWFSIVDPDAEVIVLPPIHEEKGFIPPTIMGPGERIWSDFPGYDPGHEFTKELLDLEYTYAPQDFQKMVGAKWSVFRKNCRKFPERVKGLLKLEYVDAGPEHQSGILQLFNYWFAKQGEVQDSMAMTNFVFGGEHRKVLISEGKVWGLNVWDYNLSRINYRYCISYPDDFLNEYMRWLFYTDGNREMLVNDGGVLDNPKLKAFKDKLNPISVREVYTWTRR